MPGIGLSTLTGRLLSRPKNSIEWDTLGCKRLLFAILERAIMDIVYDQKHFRPVYDTRSKGLNASLTARSALQWIMDDRDHQLPSYNAVCRYLNLDPTLLRNPKILQKVILYYSTHKADRP